MKKQTWGGDTALLNIILIDKSILVQLTPRKLCVVCVAINYTPFSMAYYTFDSTANFLSLGSTVFICISKQWHRKEELCMGCWKF